jgi:hypothetical protein
MLGLMRAARWALLVGSAAEESPFAYCFKLELQEPYRELGIGEAALVSFNSLGAKYVQVRTMLCYIHYRHRDRDRDRDLTEGAR